MKVAALKNTDPWFTRMQEAMSSGQLDAVALSGVPVENVVHVDTVAVHFDGPEAGHRPFLRISGTLRSCTPGVELPFGVQELTFSRAPATPMDYRYDFTEEEIADLVLNKGLYQPDFAVPDDVTGIEWSMPGTMDLLLVHPESVESTPLVFVDIHEQNTQQVTTETCGYDMSEYLPDRQADGPAPVAEAEGVRTRSDGIRDLFAEESLDDLYVEDEAPRPRDEGAVRAPSTFEELVEATDKARQDRRAEVEAELSQLDPQRAEAVYSDRMLAMWEQTMAELSEEAVDPQDVGLEELLDAEAEAEAGAEPVEVDQDAAERQARRRRLAEQVQEEEAAEPELEPGARPGDIVFD